MRAIIQQTYAVEVRDPEHAQEVADKCEKHVEESLALEVQFNDLAQGDVELLGVSWFIP